MPEQTKSEQHTPLTIRPAREADRARLETMISQCYNEVYPQWYGEEILDAAMETMLHIDDKLLASGHYLAAEKDGKLAGCGGWSFSKAREGEPEGSVADIRHFATSPQFMRQGVGAAILDACIEEARSAGVQRLRCFSSLAAENFYARAGFETVQEATVMLNGSIPFDAILMEKALD